MDESERQFGRTSAVRLRTWNHLQMAPESVLLHVRRVNVSPNIDANLKVKFKPKLRIQILDLKNNEGMI